MRSECKLPSQIDNPDSNNNKQKVVVIVTMHASKLKTKQEQNIQELGLKVYKER
jgi:hypothetical protein